MSKARSSNSGSVPANAGSAGGTRAITFPDLLEAFRRRCGKTLAIAIPAALLVGALVWELLPDNYIATALLQIHQYEQVMLGKSEERSAEFLTYRDSQINYMQSHPVLQEALRQEGVRDCRMLRDIKFPVEYLEETLKIEEDLSPEFLRVTLNGQYAEDVALIVNAVKDAFLNKVVHNERNHRIRILRQLETEYEELDRKVKTNESRIDQLAQDLGTGDAKVAAVIQSQLQEQIRDLQTELRELNAEIRSEVTAHEFLTERGLPDTLPLSTPGFGLSDAGSSVESNANDPRQQLAMVQRQIRQYESHLRDKNHPDLVALRKEEAALRAMFTRDGDLDENGDPITPLEWLERHRTKIEKEIAQLTEDLFTTGTRVVALERERASIASAEKIRDTLALDIENKRVELNAPERVQIIQAATAPEQMDQTLRVQLSIVALLGTFGMIVGGFVMFEWFAHRVGSANDITQQVGIRLIGSIPSPDKGGLLGTGILGGTVEPDEWQQAVVESMDVLRTYLLRHVDPSRSASILITSAAPNEGKTTITSQLAASLARIGHRVALVDCDFRRPSLHEVVSGSPKPGVSEYLRDEVPLDDICQSTEAAGLTFVAAGQVDHRALKALSINGGRAFIEELKTRFDFVIIDTPPLLFVAEPSMLAQNADMVLLATRKDFSRVPYVAQSRDSLRSLNVPLLGAVMIGADSDFQRQTYGYRQEAGQSPLPVLSR